MKALTLWEPWATYVAIGEKKFETRSWSTDYRGPLAIHSAQRLPGIGEQELIDELGLPYGVALTFGSVLATCRLVDVFRITGHEEISDREEALGDWYPGRYAWALLDVSRLAVPVKVRGERGLWDWSQP